MQTDIQKILELAVEAPSGNNSQPWRFESFNNTIEIFNIPDKDRILFNYKNRGSLIAHGALLQNITIVAKEFGYSPSFNIVPNEKENLVARVVLEKNTAQEKDPLFSFIKKRTTNRRPYRDEALKGESLQRIQDAITSKNFKIFLSEKDEDIQSAAAYFSVGDRLIFENESVHHALFSTVSWTKEEEEQKKEGLYVGTKELSAVERFIFKNLLSNWSFLKNFGWLGISDKGQAKRRKLYERSSAVGVLSAPDLSEKSLVEGGMYLQRIWLTCAQEGIAFQPLTVGMLYLGQRVLDGDAEELSKAQQELVKENYGAIVDGFVDEGQTAIFSFRIGYANPPTAQSIKKVPDIIFK